LGKEALGSSVKVRFEILKFYSVAFNRGEQKEALFA